MKTSFKKRQISVFAKILQAFLIFVLPLYFFNMLINVWGQNDVQKEVNASVQSKIEFYSTALGNEYDIINNYLNQMVSDSNNSKDLNIISNETDYNSHKEEIFDLKTTYPNSVKARLQGLMNISSYIESVSIYIPLTNIKIFAQKVNSGVSKMSKTEFIELSQYLYKSSYPFSTWRGHTCIVMSRYSSPNPKMKIPFIIYVQISDSKLQEILEQVEGDYGKAMFIKNSEYGLNYSKRTDPELVNFFTNYIKENSIKNNDIQNIKINKQNYTVAYQKCSSSLSTTLLLCIPEKQFLSSLTRYRVWIWIITIITIFAVILFALWVQRIIIRPLGKLNNAFKKMEEGDLNINLEYRSNDEFGFLYKRFNEMCKRLGRLIEQVYEEKIRTKNSELKQLQYQINPHFLYNSLFIIYRMANMHDNEGVVRLTQHLGHYYQFVTRGSSDEVPFHKEVNHAKDYVEIQTIRFSNRIKVDFGEIPLGYNNIQVPRLILQPIIENAYNHGLKDKVKDGIINIFIKKEMAFLKIFVEDNGGGLDDNKLTSLIQVLSTPDQNIESTGLLNVHRRLQIKYGMESGLFVSRSMLGGLCVEMRIVLEGEQDYV